jgi:hypothetical protein
VLVDKVSLKDVFVVERSWTEGTIEVAAMDASELMVVGPVDFGGNEQAVVAAEDDRVVTEHIWAAVRREGDNSGILLGSKQGNMMEGCFLSSRIL